MTRVAIQGIGSYWGERLCRELVERESNSQVVVVDMHQPATQSSRLTGIRTTFKAPFQDAWMRPLEKNIPDALVLCPLADEGLPPANSIAIDQRLHDALRILRKALELGIPRIIMLSSASVYGAHYDNPAFLTERSLSRGNRRDPIIGATIILEEAVLAAMSARHSLSSPAILRPVTAAGPTVRNPFISWLGMPVLPIFWGFDPVMQVIHEDDVVPALLRLLDSTVTGIFNCAAEGFLSLQEIVELSGKRTLPVFHTLLNAAGSVLWHNSLSRLSPSFWAGLRYRMIVDTAAIKEKLAFTPRYSEKKAIKDSLNPSFP